MKMSYECGLNISPQVHVLETVASAPELRGGALRMSLDGGDGSAGKGSLYPQNPCTMPGMLASAYNPGARR